MKTQRIALFAVLLSTAAFAQDGKWMKRATEGKDIYATFKLNTGDVVVRLFSKDAPKTVANFVGLAAGEKEYTDPKTGQKAKTPFYEGTIFHRVIPNFMIQGGDRTGTGRGDPGYRFEDEFTSGRKFDKPGLLAMANAGPNTNGSQFFITVSKPDYLNDRHTIFGEVVVGYDVVENVSKAPTGPMDRPQSEVVIKKIELSETAPAKSKAAAAAPKKASK